MKSFRLLPYEPSWCLIYRYEVVNPCIFNGHSCSLADLALQSGLGICVQRMGLFIGIGHYGIA